MPNTAAIFGPEGLKITPWERDFFRDADPLGFIVFARNIENPDQLRRLTDDLRESVGRDAPILIDQEGGRVQRMRAPHWREYLPALDQMQRASDPMRAQWIRNRLIAAELNAVGINVNCAPLADLVEDATHPVLRNRLYGGDIATVVEAARICAEAHLAGGVLPVLKHIPGYGRAAVDSHRDLPRVDAERTALDAHDFAPFRALNDIAMGMTAHIVFSAIDPAYPATTSTKMMQVIRQDIGFDGLIMTDDLSMEALSGTVAERASAAIAAGCDIILHCNGKPDEMEAVAEAAGEMTEAAKTRANRALAQRKTPDDIDIPLLEAEFAALLD
ncbi:glycoside hydrolase family 3 N-terminal domain-containing protein [Cognatiyoonia sp. IB215446]|uniref:glycoside hydrolase family 3 N-terminal domain-containing protein n=1 Tax=Cognatiyoonia sp. IB215446 TaxID=3097355 RepID=UPI002A106DB9|nr:glycoside hydrolase family 3 N-terminal domain-containing protein [Cognatiyoonia sp. IB215446]MDX8349733.1 glycoside hydrolase family 3 N-terminal domain-containing protein [Cognatiyoonia sp. IB215446]